MALALASSMSASAEEQMCVRGDTAVHTLEEVTISEGRRNVVSATIPVYVVGSGEMRLTGVTTMADALHRMPGVTLRDYGGAGGMKTVSVHGLGSQHTGVVYDGVTLSECQNGAVDLSRYSLDNVDHVSLSMGDADDIFVPARQAATPATVSIYSDVAMPTDGGTHATAQLRLGSFGYVSPYVKVGGKPTERLYLSMLGEYVYAENDYPYTLRNGTTKVRKRRTNSMMNAGHGEANMTWHAGAGTWLTGKLYYYDNDRELPGVARYYSDTGQETLRERNAFAQLRFVSERSRRLSVKAHAKFNWSMSDYKDGAYYDGVRDVCYWQREAYGSLSLLWRHDDKWSADYSVDYAFNNLSSSLASDNRPRRHTVLQVAAVKYASGRVAVTARLLGSLYFNKSKGIKGNNEEGRDKQSARDMKKLSPSLSLSYRLLADEELYVRASYKNIFRVPTFNESYYFHYGSTDLKAESTDQISVGASWLRRYRGGSTLRLTGDAYINKVKDKIQAVPFNMFIWTCKNLGDVRGRGVDFTAMLDHKFNLRHALMATLTYGYQHIVDRTERGDVYYDKQLAYTPEHHGSAGVGYTNPWVNLSLSGNAMSTRYSRGDHVAGSEVAGYMELNVSAWRVFALWGATAELRAEVRNLLDKQYMIVAKYPMTGRSFMMEMKYKF